MAQPHHSRSRTGILMRNNTSGVPCIRPRLRVNRFGRRSVELDVSAFDENGKRRFTSFPIGRAPVRAVELAMQWRTQVCGVQHEKTPRQAWYAMRHLVGGIKSW